MRAQRSKRSSQSSDERHDDFILRPSQLETVEVVLEREEARRWGLPGRKTSYYTSQTRRGGVEVVNSEEHRRSIQILRPGLRGSSREVTRERAVEAEELPRIILGETLRREMISSRTSAADTRVRSQVPRVEPGNLETPRQLWEEFRPLQEADEQERLSEMKMMEGLDRLSLAVEPAGQSSLSPIQEEAGEISAEKSESGESWRERSQVIEGRVNKALDKSGGLESAGAEQISGSSPGGPAEDAATEVLEEMEGVEKNNHGIDASPPHTSGREYNYDGETSEPAVAGSLPRIDSSPKEPRREARRAEREARRAHTEESTVNQNQGKEKLLRRASMRARQEAEEAAAAEAVLREARRRSTIRWADIEKQEDHAVKDTLGVFHELADRSDILNLPNKLGKASLDDLVYTLETRGGRHRYVMNLAALQRLNLHSMRRELAREVSEVIREKSMTWEDTTRIKVLMADYCTWL